MRPAYHEYLEELAERADPDQLWRLSGLDQLDLPPEKRRQLDTAVALRRYAAHILRLRELREQGRSLLITPLSELGTAVKSVDTPPDHVRLREGRDRSAAAAEADPTFKGLTLSDSVMKALDSLDEQANRVIGELGTNPPQPRHSPDQAKPSPIDQVLADMEAVDARVSQAIVANAANPPTRYSGILPDLGPAGTGAHSEVL